MSGQVGDGGKRTKLDAKKRRQAELLREYQRVTDEILADSPHMVFSVSVAEHHEEAKAALDEKGDQRERGAVAAAKRKAEREERDGAIAGAALRLAAQSDELTENPKELAARLLECWEGDYQRCRRVNEEHPWGKPCSPNTLYGILSSQGVLARLRGA